MLIGFALFELFPGTLLSFFNASPKMLEIGIPALRIVAVPFIFAGYCIVIGSVFQALGNGVYSLIVSLTRQLIVLLPAAFLLSKAFGLAGVWWAFPIAEIASVIVTTICFGRINRDILKPMTES